MELHGVPFRFQAGTAACPAVSLAIVHGPGDASPVWDEIGAGAARFAADPPVDPTVVDAVIAAAWRWGAATGALPVVDLTDGLPPEAVVRLVRRWSVRIARIGGTLAFRTRQAMPVAALQRKAPRPTWSQRRDAWRVASAVHDLPVDEAFAERLASACRLGPTAVDEVCRSAGVCSADALMARAVEATRVPIPHGTTLEPRRTFDDLVLTPASAEAIRRLLYFLRHRDALAEHPDLEHRFRLSRGPLVQFAGPSGTGKTLTAEVVAGDIGRLLHVVDLARLVSKYIGETERHVDEVLSAAEDAGAVLMFDEADALFSKRTEVSNSTDRYANLEVGYLLQRIESHEGMVILSTNLAGSIDEAFLRRFHARIEFPQPREEERTRIWELMLPVGVARADGLDLSGVSRRHRLSGGDIRNAALKAILLAHRAGAAVGLDHLEEAVAVELHEQGRLSRRADPPRTDRGRTLWAFTDALQRRVEQELRETFLKEVHVIHGAPTRENLAGHRPAVSMALFRLAMAGNGALRVGFVLAAWANRAEEEHELLGLLHQWLSSSHTVELHGRQVPVRVAESFDFDLLWRYWSSHSQPMKASVVLDADLPDPTRGPSHSRDRA